MGSARYLQSPEGSSSAGSEACNPRRHCLSTHLPKKPRSSRTAKRDKGFVQLLLSNLLAKRDVPSSPSLSYVCPRVVSESQSACMPVLPTFVRNLLFWGGFWGEGAGGGYFGADMQGASLGTLIRSLYHIRATASINSLALII